MRFTTSPGSGRAGSRQAVRGESAIELERVSHLNERTLNGASVQHMLAQKG
jgi:hypothetical protein